MKNKTAYILLLIVGITTCLSFFPHAFLGMKAVNEHIEKGEILPIAAKGMRKIWLYSSITMLLIGIWILILANQLKKGVFFIKNQVLIIGLGLIIFALSCFYIEKGIDDMVLFLIQGIVLIIASFSIKNKKEV